MKQTEFISKAAMRAGCPQRIVRNVMRAVKSVIAEQLHAGKSAKLPKFNIFSIRKRTQYRIINSGTHEIMVTKEKLYILLRHQLILGVRR
jgi:nucleoid DNA-binding protein